MLNLASCNELTVGIFSWAMLEPREGEYDFSFLDEIIDKIHAAGGRVILATPSASRPRWMADAYPEVLRVSENGANRYLFVQNYSDVPVCGISMGGVWRDLESAEVTDTVDLAAFDVKIFKNIS